MSFIESSAILSADGWHRYSLLRVWDKTKPLLAFVMLNPSTADAEKDDPTIRRCIGFAKREDCGGILVENVFAYRATNPDELERIFGCIGNDNVAKLLDLFERKDIGKVVVAWGTSIKAQRTSPWYAWVVSVMANNVVYCLGVTKDGHPRHPLYLKKDAKLIRWRPQGPLGDLISLVEEVG